MTRDELWAVEDATRDAFHDQREREARQRVRCARSAGPTRVDRQLLPRDDPPPF